MPTVEFSDAAYEKLVFAAKVAGVTLTEAVDRVFATFNSPIASHDCDHTHPVLEKHQDERPDHAAAGMALAAPALGPAHGR